MTIPEQLPLYILSIFCIVLFIWLVRTELRLAKFMRRSSTEPIEAILEQILSENKEILDQNTHIKEFLNTLDYRVKRSAQHVKTLRFDPYGENGGKQSFATAILDEHGNGVVISTLYSRERTSIFAKPIEQFSSAHELTSEERSVIQPN